MATPKQYALVVRAASKRIARKMGLHIDGEAKPLRVVAGANAMQLGVILNLLEEKGVLTAAEVQAAFTTAGDDDYPDEPADP